MGRPVGSKDRLPRQKRTKLQLLVDKQIGHPRNKKKDVRVTAQHPCETCGSCVRVQFVSNEEVADSSNTAFLHAMSPYVSQLGIST